MNIYIVLFVTLLGILFILYKKGKSYEYIHFDKDKEYHDDSINGPIIKPCLYKVNILGINFVEKEIDGIYKREIFLDSSLTGEDDIFGMWELDTSATIVHHYKK